MSSVPELSYLEAYLEPLMPALSRAAVTDVYVNRPGEMWVEALGAAPERVDAPSLTSEMLWRIGRQVAALAHQGLSREHPLLSANLPDGSRFQIIVPPATRGEPAIAIRKHLIADFSLGALKRAGTFGTTSRGGGVDPQDALLRDLHRNGDISELLAAAVRARKTILVSGGTSTGKTTFLNALLREVPGDERLVLIEDTPEIRIQHENAVGLIAARGELGEARVTATDLLEAALRMRPDRIILGELRGAEAFAFLRAVNTGHPGSMTTIHADTPARAVEQLALLVLQTGVSLRREDIVAYVESIVDVYVQLGRAEGRRVVTEVSMRKVPS